MSVRVVPMVFEYTCDNCKVVHTHMSDASPRNNCPSMWLALHRATQISTNFAPIHLCCECSTEFETWQRLNCRRDLNKGIVP